MGRLGSESQAEGWEASAESRRALGAGRLCWEGVLGPCRGQAEVTSEPMVVRVGETGLRESFERTVCEHEGRGNRKRVFSFGLKKIF